MLAELLGWPMATFAATVKEEDGALLVGREVDGGVLSLRVKLPAVVTVDLRIVAPTSVYSKQTAPTFKYNDGVRFAALPAIMSAKKKPLVEAKLAELSPDTTPRIRYVSFEPPPARKAGVKVKSVAELVEKLVNEAKVL
jgi:electron transfer flavoprotein beta subunit